MKSWPGYFFKANRTGPTDYLCEFDHADVERARRSVLWHRDWNEQTEDVLDVMSGLELLRDGLQVLDYGCGIGRIAERLLSRHSLQLCAVDRSLHMRRHAQAALARFMVAEDGTTNPRCAIMSDVELLAHERTFDLVVLVELVQHVPEPILDKLLPALWRMVRTGGSVFVYGNRMLDVDRMGLPWRTTVQDVVSRHMAMACTGTKVRDESHRHWIFCRRTRGRE